MLQASVIYAAVTILLAYVDAIRIKVNWDKVKNIDHTISWELGLIAGAAVMLYCVLILRIHADVLMQWKGLAVFILYVVSFISIRVAVFDLALNVFRLLFKINPTLRLDYVSTKTSSYEDQHSEKIGFWQKRALAVAAWFILYIVYRLIFK